MTEPILLERTLEDWVCENVAHVLPSGEGAEVLGRQWRLPSGQIIDVLAGVACDWKWAQGLALYVIEIKRDQITPAAVAQLLSYMGQVEALVPKIAEERGLSPFDISVFGVLAAPSINLDAAHCVNALRFKVYHARLAVQIAAQVWEEMPVRYGSEDDAAKRIANTIPAVELRTQAQTIALMAGHG